MQIFIAIIVTTYNRRILTERCIKQLLQHDKKYFVDIFVFDDNSTDGTFEMLNSLGNHVYVRRGSGNYYWSRGMYEAMKMSIDHREYDFYLMVNDDVSFFDNVFDKMLEPYVAFGRSCGVAGLVKTTKSDAISYCGRNIIPFKIGPLTFGDKSYHMIKPVKKEDGFSFCDVANWNCFLIDKKIFKDIGFIDGSYSHGKGDYDYTLRMKKKGYPTIASFEFVGMCDQNPLEGSYKDPSLSIVRRLKLLFSRKGLPFKSSFRFAFRHFGLLGVIIFFVRYLKLILVILLKKKI